MYKAIRLAWQLSLEKIIIVTDAKEVLEKIKKPTYESDNYSIILDIKLKILLQQKAGKRIVIVWVPRQSVKGNIRADQIAKEERQETRGKFLT